MVSEIADGQDSITVFRKLKRINLSRVELMIIDSAVKGMPLNNLDKTLLLPQHGYDTMLQNLTFKLVELYQTEPRHNTMSTGPR